MGFDQGLLDRIRKIIAGVDGAVEAKMFGGVAVMVHGNMAVAVRDDELFVRLGEQGAQTALREPCVRVMDVTGRPMKSYVTVSAEGLVSDDALKNWVMRGVAFARTLPPK